MLFPFGQRSSHPPCLITLSNRRCRHRMSSHLLLTPGLLWVALYIWSGLEVAFFIYLHFIVHPRLEPPSQAPQGSLPPREILTRLIDTLDRLKGVSELSEGLMARGQSVGRSRRTRACIRSVADAIAQWLAVLRAHTCLRTCIHVLTHTPTKPMHMQVYEPERFWVNWFRGVPIGEIRRENIKVRPLL